MNHSRIIAYVELTIAAILIGSSIVAGKITTMQMPVFLSQAISLVIALLLLIPILMLSGKSSLRVGRKDFLFLLLQAFLGMFLFRVFMLYGLRTALATEAGIVTSLTPAVVAFLSYMILKEKLTNPIKIGIICSILGVVSIQVPGWLIPSSGPPSKASYIGLLLILGAVVGESMLTILRKMTASNVSSLLGTTYVTLFSFIMFLPIALVEAKQYDFSSVTVGDIGLLFYYGIFVTALAYILWFRGVSKVSAGTAAVYTSCIPLSTVLLSYGILNEPFSWSHLVGGAFVCLGIWQVSKSDSFVSRKPKKSPKSSSA
ncbi:multidrug transporter [Paenibacillus sp. FSL A5-0031]|uniref:DMT family transporter n=1 Tax=Paenibacillus sp. FSL A5-0031 TaxID=1920420 RepID=UPI0009701D53|nr:DMT family transporter [Paenibacillus sp. FSL A5-0031]OME79447.1 multidrug transporter [Paenibacillus sp. FSL A5-0031]